MNSMKKVTALLVGLAAIPNVFAEDISKNFNPSYSPDGKYMTYYSYRGESSPDIYVSKADGTEERRLTVNENYADIEPVWSKDGKRIYFAGGPTQKSLNLFSTDLHGKNVVQHTFTDTDKGIKGKSIASDGKHIVYSRVAANGGYEIVMSSLNGDKNKQVQVLVAARHKDEQHMSPDWQPSGNKVIFVSNRSGRKDNDIYSYDLVTSEIRRMTDINGYIMFPRWSADGQSVTFSANLNGKTNDVFSINSTGGELTNLTKDSEKSQFFSWVSKDGGTLLFDSGDWKKGFQIFAMDMNKGESKALTSL